MPLQTLNRAIHLYRANPAVSHGLFLAGAGALGMASYSAVEHLRVDSSHLLQETTGQESQRKNQEMALQRILDDMKRKKFEARMEKHRCRPQRGTWKAEGGGWEKQHPFTSSTLLQNTTTSKLSPSFLQQGPTKTEQMVSKKRLCG